MADIVREVYKRLAATPGHPLYLEHRDATRAISAVLDKHGHVFLDEYLRETTDMSAALYGRCETCGNLDRPQVYCDTTRALGSALGVREDGD